jgi:octaprenyl-diphosphate synthase
MLTAETRRVSASVNALPPFKPLGWKQIVEAVEPFLQSVAHRLGAQTQEFDPLIASHAQYALTAQGKQLRPLLVSLSGEAVGELNDSHITVAVIIEMVHLATLVHDDVIDGGEMRRGRPSMAVNCGNNVSVLLGDCLFAHALKLAASFPTPEICRAVAAAANIVCAGEILQTQSRGDFDVSRERYFKMVGMKTAELFALSCDLGAFLSGTSPARREALRQYGMALGTAYQLYDDCLDVLGSEATAGKTLGADLANGKLTLPILIVRERADGADLKRLRQWMRLWDASSLEEVVAMIAKYDAFQEARSVIQGQLAAAQEALAVAPQNDAAAGLLGLTQFLAEQTEALGVIY